MASKCYKCRSVKRVSGSKKKNGVQDRSKTADNKTEEAKIMSESKAKATLETRLKAEIVAKKQQKKPVAIPLSAREKPIVTLEPEVSEKPELEPSAANDSKQVPDEASEPEVMPDLDENAMIRSERVALKQNAKQMIKGKIWRMFLAALIVWGITMVLDMGGKPEYEAGFSAFCSSFFVPRRIVGFLGTFFILPPLMLGLSYLYLDVAGGKDFKISLIFDGFSDFWRVVLMNLLQTIYVFLWGLLLIVPGIIKLISYSQVNFILAENHGKTLLPSLEVFSERSGMKIDVPTIQFQDGCGHLIQKIAVMNEEFIILSKRKIVGVSVQSGSVLLPTKVLISDWTSLSASSRLVP